MKPILFNINDVRGILDGQKSMTRRIIKPQPGKDAVKPALMDDGTYQFLIAGCTMTYDYITTPKYKKGDILWARETWKKDSENGYQYRADFESDYLDPCETLPNGCPVECPKYPGYVRYPGCVGCNVGSHQRIKWRPSIHMPREAARLFLRVTDVRVERLKDISLEDVIAERAWESTDAQFINEISDGNYDIPYAFAWDYFYVKESEWDEYGWKANPWVWVISFEQISKEEAEKEAG